MSERVEEVEYTGSEEPSEENLREGMYKQFDVTPKEQMGIRYILPILDRVAQAESRYDIDSRSKILAEISLIRAYIREPKFKVLATASVLLASYDFLHTFNPAFYGIILGAIVTFNGFIASLRSPPMIAAELEGAKDENGMPAHYRTKAISSANTNITLFLFAVAVCVQLLVTSSFVQGELLAENVADGTLHPAISALVLFALPIIRVYFPESSDPD